MRAGLGKCAGKRFLDHLQLDTSCCGHIWARHLTRSMRTTSQGAQFGAVASLAPATAARWVEIAGKLPMAKPSARMIFALHIIIATVYRCGFCGNTSVQSASSITSPPQVTLWPQLLSVGQFGGDSRSGGTAFSKLELSESSEYNQEKVKNWNHSSRSELWFQFFRFFCNAL